MGDKTTPPSYRRVLAIGDIHGCLGQLRCLLNKVAPTQQDCLVFLGDAIDRGEDSPGVIDFLLSLRQQFQQSVFLLGNHEQMLLKYLRGQAGQSYLQNGGEATLRQYRRRGSQMPPGHHLMFLQNLALSWQFAGHLFVHAGLRPGTALPRQSKDDMLWIRQEFLEHPNPCEWELVVVHGHTPQKQVSFSPCRIGVDTGAGYGRQLSCCDVLSHQVWQSP